MPTAVAVYPPRWSVSYGAEEKEGIERGGEKWDKERQELKSRLQNGQVIKILFFTTQWHYTGTMNTTHFTTLNLIMLFTSEQQWSAQLLARLRCRRKVIFTQSNGILQPYFERKTFFFFSFFFFQRHPGAYHGCLAACLSAFLFAPTSLLPGAGGSPSLPWAHSVRLLIHLEPELSQCHQPPIRSIGPRAGDMA